MFKKLRDLYLLENGFFGEPKVLDQKTYMALSDEEKELVDVRVEGDEYIIKTPLEANDAEMDELIGITISRELKTIREYLREIKFIMQYCFISAIIGGVIVAALLFLANA